MGVGSLNQSLNLSAVESIHSPAALARRFQMEFAAGLFDDVLGLVISKVMPTP
jgi:hypothetical protein